jgi:hypothetical protein
MHGVEKNYVSFQWKTSEKNYLLVHRNILEQKKKKKDIYICVLGCNSV